MAKLEFDPKDPDEVDDFAIDWTERLNGETISTSTWTATGGVTVDSDTFTDTVATARLSGGTLNAHAVVTNRIVTDASRTLDQSANLKIRAK